MAMHELLATLAQALWGMFAVAGHLVFSVKVENVSEEVSYFVD